jgi:hypothetical protein
VLSFIKQPEHNAFRLLNGRWGNSKARLFEESGLSKTRLIDHRRALGARRRGMRLGVARCRGQQLAPGYPLTLSFRRGGRFGVAAKSVRKLGSVSRGGI